MAMELAIKRTNGVDLAILLEPGRPLYVVGPNGSGKSALIQHAVTQLGSGKVRRMSAHRQTFLESAEINTTARVTSQFFQNLQRREGNPQYRYSEYDPQIRLSSVLYSLTAKDNAQARRIRDLMRAGYREEADGIPSGEKSPFESINELLTIATLKVSIEYSGTEQILAWHQGSSEPYDMAQMSDGERNAVLLAAEVLTVAEGMVLLIDEPERHLHRSIIEPLLSAMFALRPDCPFVVSTHEIGLPISDPDAAVLILRSCQWNGNSAAAWDANLLEGDADLLEDVKRAILGSRRRVLFVEGESQSLDKQLYSALFPDISVFPVGDHDRVIKSVESLQEANELHEVTACGLIDADNRNSDEIFKLSQKGIFALNGYSVESIYYCGEAIAALAEQQADFLGGDANELKEAARSAALAALKDTGVPERMAARRCEREVRQKAHSQMPNWETIQNDTIQPIQVDAQQLFRDELERFHGLLEKNDLAGIITRYPARHTNAFAEIEKALEISKQHYRRALISRIGRDAEFADRLKARVQPLATVFEQGN